MKVFINAPYEQVRQSRNALLERQRSRCFIGAGGIDVRTQSLVAVIAGGLAFDTPPFAAMAEPAAATRSLPSTRTRRRR